MVVALLRMFVVSYIYINKYIYIYIYIHIYIYIYNTRYFSFTRFSEDFAACDKWCVCNLVQFQGIRYHLAYTKYSQDVFSTRTLIKLYGFLFYRHFLNRICPLGHHLNDLNGFVFVQKLHNFLRRGCTHFCDMSLWLFEGKGSRYTRYVIANKNRNRSFWRQVKIISNLSYFLARGSFDECKVIFF